MPDTSYHSGLDTNRVIPNHFNVLLTGLNYPQVVSIFTYVEMLHNYIETLGLDNKKIVIHVITESPNGFRGLAGNPYFYVHHLESVTADSILNLSDTLDIDIILDEQELISKNEIHRNREKVAIVHWYNPHFTDLLNAICTGWGVVWNFREPIFNAPWVSKYFEPGQLARKVFDFMQISKEKNFNDKEVNLIRNMANKISQINHAKQLIEYLKILNRYSVRHELKTDDILFNLTYHLNTYNLLIPSTLDVMARLYNSIYDLGYSEFNSYTLDRDDFLVRLGQKRASATKIIKLKKYLDWIFWMKSRRNYFAHEGHTYLSPIVQRKANELSVAEIERLVDGEMDWNLIRSAARTQEEYDSLREFTNWRIDYEQNYETIVNDIMTINKQDRITKEIKEVVLFPLRAVDEDYKNFSDLLTRLFDNLTKARKVR